MVNICSRFEVNECLRTSFLQNVTQLVYTTKSLGGCVSYELFHDLDNRNIYYIFEIWKNEACEVSKKKSKLYTEYMQEIVKTLNNEIEINKIEKSI
jgi:quinol monooxygenase YgiN